MSFEQAQDTLRKFKPARLKDWDVRAFTALHALASGDRLALAMILISAMGSKAGPLRAPRFGENAIITKERTIKTRYINARNFDCGAREVMTVDQLNRYLSWLINAIDATDEEYKAIVNLVNGWISRDETQIGLHVEKQRTGLDNPTDLSEFKDDIAIAEERQRKAAQDGEERS